MKKRVVQILLVIVAAIMLFIVAQKNIPQIPTKEDIQTTKTFGVSVDQKFASRMEVVEAIKEEAQKRGYCVKIEIADGDAQTQNLQIEDMISQHVAAILVCAVDQNTIEDTLKEAKKANIPVVAFDRDLPDSKEIDAYVGPDSLNDGKKCGKEMVKYFENETESIKVLELVGALNDQNGIDRSKGFNEEIAKADNIEVIQMPTDWDVQTALQSIQLAFQTNPDIKGVFCASDSFFPCIETISLEKGINGTTGMPNHIFVNGVNGSKEGYETILKGYADGFLVMDLKTTGQMAVSLADQIVNHESVKRTNLVSGIYYTYQNVETNKNEIWGAKE